MGGSDNSFLSYKVPTTSGKASGEIIYFGSAGQTFAFGETIFLTTTGWFKTDADISTATNMIGMALGNSPTTDGVLLRGFAREGSWSFTTGRPLYLGRTTAGSIIESLTTDGFTTGDYVRVVAYQVATNTLFFNPDNTWVQL